jgi:hypothetical protein
MSDQIDAPAALSPGEKRPVPIRYEAGLDIVEYRKIFCPCQELNPGRPVCNRLSYVYCILDYSVDVMFMPHVSIVTCMNHYRQGLDW